MELMMDTRTNVSRSLRRIGGGSGGAGPIERRTERSEKVRDPFGAVGKRGSGAEI